MLQHTCAANTRSDKRIMPAAPSSARQKDDAGNKRLGNTRRKEKKGHLNAKTNRNTSIYRKEP